MDAKVITTTLCDYRQGACHAIEGRSPYYTGKSKCYAVQLIDATGYEFEIAFNRKWAAEALADWVNSGAWSGNGEVVMCWTKATIFTDERTQRFADGEAKEV